jgi:hydroxyacylglutathione hydrolase
MALHRRSLIEARILVVGALHTNCYILQSRGESIIVDPGDEGERILRLIKDLETKPTSIIATHTHFDHVLAVNTIRKRLNVPFLIHRDDLPLLESMQSRVRHLMGFEVPPPPSVDGFLKDEEVFTLGNQKVKILHTPGHSPGSVSISTDETVFTGDALFNQSIGRTDLPGGDLKTLIHSIREKLFKLDDETTVYPGHGPETTIGDEKLANPFVGKAARFSE